MDIEILASETLKCYPGLEQQLRLWANLSSIPVDGLLVRILHGSLIDEEFYALLWKFDPGDLTDMGGRPVFTVDGSKPREIKITGHYCPGVIELDFLTDRPRWGLVALWFFHELAHHRDYLQGVKLTEEAADAFARRMMKQLKEILPFPCFREQMRLPMPIDKLREKRTQGISG